MLFSEAQQKVMNLAADVLSSAKKDEEKFRDIAAGGYASEEVIYVLNDVALKVKVEVETVKVVTA